MISYDPFVPLKIYNHGIHSIYSKSKGGVDGIAQARAILRSPAKKLKWEQKVVCQTLKAFFVNAFVAWRIDEKMDLADGGERFQSFENF